MADLRYDPLTDSWVAIARKRLERPVELVPVQEVQQQILCPFCRGNEDETPPATQVLDAQRQRVSSSNSTDWSTRIVPNKYPSLNAEPAGEAPTPFRSIHQDGVQEIVIPTPRHMHSVSQLSLAELTVALYGIRRRMQELAQMPGILHVQLFMNVGAAAGATLSHIHLQMIGSPVVSPAIERRSKRNLRWTREHGVSLVESIRQSELEAGTRLVDRSDGFCVVCPFASRFGFQTWIIPEDASPVFGQLDDDRLESLARHLIHSVRRLEQVLDRPAYNLILHHAPMPDDQPGWPWFFELFPRFAVPAGFEFGADIWVNPVPPEFAARRLRSAVETI